MDIPSNVYTPDCHMRYGVLPDCVSQLGGAGAHTSSTATSYCRKNIPLFWDKKAWRPHSPGLNVLDYCLRGYLKEEATQKQPTCLDSLNLAIRRIADNMPIEVAHRSIQAPPKRVSLCISAGRSTIKPSKFAEDTLEYPLLLGPEEADGGDDASDDAADEWREFELHFSPPIIV